MAIDVILKRPRKRRASGLKLGPEMMGVETILQAVRYPASAPRCERFSLAGKRSKDGARLVPVGPAMKQERKEGQPLYLSLK